jgi:hypothetical protein
MPSPGYGEYQVGLKGGNDFHLFVMVCPWDVHHEGLLSLLFTSSCTLFLAS